MKINFTFSVDAADTRRSLLRNQRLAIDIPDEVAAAVAAGESLAERVAAAGGEPDARPDEHHAAGHALRSAVDAATAAIGAVTDEARATIVAAILAHLRKAGGG